MQVAKSLDKDSIAEMRALAGEFTVATLRNLRDLAVTASDLPDIKFCATMLPKVAELVPGLVEQAAQQQHQVIIDISRLPGAAEALQAEVVDVMPPKPKVELLDAPEPRFGASDETAQAPAVQDAPVGIPDVAAAIDDLVNETARPAPEPVRKPAKPQKADADDPLGGLSISSFIFDDA